MRFLSGASRCVFGSIILWRLGSEIIFGHDVLDIVSPHEFGEFSQIRFKVQPGVM
jgi:hypothetical protein